VASNIVVAGLLTDLDLTDASAHLLAADDSLLQLVNTQTKVSQELMGAYTL